MALTGKYKLDSSNRTAVIEEGCNFNIMTPVETSSLSAFSNMAFAGKYELESQENYEEFLEATGLLHAKTDYKVVTEVVQDGNDFTWTQTIPNWTWSNKFTVGQECEMQTMTGSKFKAPVTMEGGKISMQFPQYLFTAEISEEKLIMHCVIPGVKGVVFKRVSKRI